MGLDLNTALISDTFDGLIKTTDGNVLTSTPLVLTDGRGNDSSLALSTAGNGVTITGTLTVGGVDIGGDLATAKSDITAIETKTDFITVTGAINLDTIKTKVDFITVTQAVDLDTIESDIASATAKTQYITVTQAVNLDTMESDILSAKTKTDFITIGQPVNLDNVESGLATAEADIIAIEAKTDFITVTGNVNLDTVASNASAAKTKTDFLTVTQAVDLDTLESDVNTAKGDITAIEAKTDNITVTQAVNLDTMESDLASSKAKTDFITITQAVNLDTVESGLSQAQTDINLIEVKTNNITVTQAVNLDTMESDIATNNAKNSYPAGDATKVGFISVTQAVDLDSMEIDISNLSTNKYDKTGGTISGAVTITGDLTVNGTTTTVNTQTLSVKDPLIELANDNSANSVDTGFYANYSEDAGVTTKYAGLFKDAGDSDKFKLFKGLEVEPTTTVDTAGTGYTKGDLVVNDLDAVTISGTLSTAAQPNITSVGTLSSLAVSGNLTVDTNTLFVDASNNRVGIGTSSANSKLQVVGAVQDQIRFGSNTSVYTDLWMGTGYTVFDSIGGNSGAFDFRDDGTSRMFIDSSGNVLVGKSSTGIANDGVEINSVGQAFFTCTGGAGVQVNRKGSDGNAITMFNDGTEITSFAMAGSDLQVKMGGSERMRIDSSGNVGIGIAPSAKLTVFSSGGYSVFSSGKAVNGIDIQGTAGGSGNYASGVSFGVGGVGRAAISAVQNSADTDVVGLAFFTHGSSTGSADAAEAMRIGSSGNVGIGEQSPLAGMDSGYRGIEINGTYPVVKLSNGATDYGTFEGDANANYISTSGARYLALFTNDSERMRIDSSGNVGIGTSTPATKLTVLSADAPTLDNSTHAGEALFLRSGGSAGQNNIQSVLAFGKADGANLRSGSAIASVQTGTDADQIGLAFYTSPSSASAQTLSEKLRINHDGGILFNGDTAAANALDDYEEGTFTPTYIGSGGGAVTGYGVASGTYTKIGNVVTLYIQITAGKGTISGDISIGGIPYAGTGYVNMTTRRRFATDFQLGGIVGASQIDLYKIKSDELTPLTLTDTDFNSSGVTTYNDIRTTITYITA